MRFPLLLPLLLPLLALAPAALAQPAGPATPATTEPVRREDVPVQIVANGLVVPENVVTIGPRAAVCLAFLLCSAAPRGSPWRCPRVSSRSRTPA